MLSETKNNHRTLGMNKKNICMTVSCKCNLSNTQVLELYGGWVKVLSCVDGYTYKHVPWCSEVALLELHTHIWTNIVVLVSLCIQNCTSRAVFFLGSVTLEPSIFWRMLALFQTFQNKKTSWLGRLAFWMGISSFQIVIFQHCCLAWSETLGTHSANRAG